MGCSWRSRFRSFEDRIQQIQTVQRYEILRMGREISSVVGRPLDQKKTNQYSKIRPVAAY